MVRHQTRSSQKLRQGLASLEAVVATAITLPVVILLFNLGVRACKQLWQVIGAQVGWPYL